MHTFRKLPINSPKRKAIIAAVMRAPAGTTSMVQPRDEGSLRLLVPESRIELGRERVQHGNAGEPVDSWASDVQSGGLASPRLRETQTAPCRPARNRDRPTSLPRLLRPHRRTSLDWRCRSDTRALTEYAVFDPHENLFHFLRAPTDHISRILCNGV